MQSVTDSSPLEVRFKRQDSLLFPSNMWSGLWQVDAPPKN